MQLPPDDKLVPGDDDPCPRCGSDMDHRLEGLYCSNDCNCWIHIEDRSPDIRERIENHSSGVGWVLAGSGAGKTTIASRWIERLIHDKVDPNKIMVVSFTNEAVINILKKLNVKMKYVGTFHHIANLLRAREGQLEHGKVLGSKDPDELESDEDDDDKEKVPTQETVYKRAYDEEKRYELERRTQHRLNKIKEYEEDHHNSRSSRDSIERVKSWAEKSLPSIETIKDLHEKARNILRDIKDVIIDRTDEDKSFIQNVVNRYNDIKENYNYIDFCDMIERFSDIMQDPAVSDKICASFTHVLIDEYQDIYPLQKKAFKPIVDRAQAALLVGDDMQSIYRFLGAGVENMVNISEEYKNVTLYIMTKDFRHQPRITGYLNTCLAHNPEQIKRAIISQQKDGPEPIFRELGSDKEEVQYICAQVIERRDQQVPLELQAILMRKYSANYCHLFQNVFLTERIPFKFGFRQFMPLYRRKIVKDALAFIAIVLDDTDEEAWRRALTIMDGLGARAAELVIAHILSKTGLIKQTPLDKFLKLGSPFKVSEKGCASIHAMQCLIKDMKDRRLNKRPIHDSLGGIWHLVSSQRKGKDGKTAHHKKAFDDFFDAIKDYDDLDDVKAAFAPRDDFITITTIHKAKGRQWNTVYLPFASEGTMPLLTHKQDESVDLEELAEERRIFCVGFGRAAELAVVTWPKGPERSRFVDEMLKSPLREIQRDEHIKE